jgi:hypothetical protein
MEGLNETTKVLRIAGLGPRFEPGTSEYEAGALTTWPWRSMIIRESEINNLYWGLTLLQRQRDRS